MVHVMAALPPADREPAAEVGDEDAYQRVEDEVVRYGTMACIVSREHDLVLRGTISLGLILNTCAHL